MRPCRHKKISAPCEAPLTKQTATRFQNGPQAIKEGAYQSSGETTTSAPFLGTIPGVAEVVQGRVQIFFAQKC